MDTEEGHEGGRQEEKKKATREEDKRRRRRSIHRRQRRRPLYRCGPTAGWFGGSTYRKLIRW
jgi:hypothetical protein